ncbi:MAG: hypothetical protein ACI9O0_000699 [Paracoccaceae bacterium]
MCNQGEQAYKWTINLNSTLTDLLLEPALALPLLGFLVFISAVVFWTLSSYLVVRKQSKSLATMQAAIHAMRESFKKQKDEIESPIQPEITKPEPRQIKDHRIGQILDMLDQQALALSGIKSEMEKFSSSDEKDTGLNIAIERARSGATSQEIQQETGISTEQADAIVRFHGTARD